MGLDEKQTAGLAFDVHASLISIEATHESAHALPLAARRICSQMRSFDSVLLLGRICVLLLPATPFSGAQALAGRVAQFLTNVPCEMHVYHGTTALLVLQRLRDAGAIPVARDNCAELPPPALPVETGPGRGEKKETPAAALPYLAFLPSYPAPHLLHLFPYELACRYQCVPVGAERNMLTLATCRWLNREIIAQFRTVTRRGIFQVRCEVSMIDEILRYWQRLPGAMDNPGAHLEKDEVCSSSR